MFPGNTVNAATLLPRRLSESPTIASITAVSSTQLDVAYSVPGFTGDAKIVSYSIVVTPGNITATRLGTGPSTISFTGLTPGTNYTFTVYNTDEFGIASKSSTPSTPVQAPPLPANAPTIGTATKTSNTQATVSYTAPVYNGGSAITSYTAVSSPGGITGTLSQAGSGTITVSGLTFGTSYTFTVYATTAAGQGTSSAASNSVSPSNAPTIGTATKTSNTQATVSYTAPANTGNSAIVSYTAVSSPGGITATLVTAGSGTITVSGLTFGTSYTFTVYSTNYVGNSTASAASNAVSVSDAPTIGTATAISSTQATVSYTAPANTGNSAIVSYTAVSSPGGITATLVTAGSGTITVPGLTPGANYTFTVYATNYVGNSTASANSNSTLVPAIVPNAPTGVSASYTSGSSATISYTAPVYNGGAAITTYTVTSSPGAITASVSQSGSGSIVITGLTGSTAYTFTVNATNSAGSGPASSASNSITTAPGVPGVPTIGTATKTSNTQATVAYTAPTSNGGGTITLYTAVSSPGGITGSIARATSGIVTINGLTFGVDYSFTVYATNSGGNSLPSAASNTLTAPDAPNIGTVNPNAVAGNMTVPFTAPAFNGGSTIQSYTATSIPGGFRGTVNQAGSGSVIVGGLTPGASYSFTINAKNFSGVSAESAESNIAVVNTTIPYAPTIGTATATGTASATVSFTAAFDGGSPITSYIATSAPGGFTGTISQAGSGTITVNGLTRNTSYTFTVKATSAKGTSAASAASNSITTPSTSIPGPPTIGTAVVSALGQITVPFTAPASNGFSAITSYTATSTPGGFTGTLVQAGSGSIIVTGLDPATSYTFTVYATNAVGNGLESAASNAIVPAWGSILFYTGGSWTWTAPFGVTSVSVLAVGTGGGGNCAAISAAGQLSSFTANTLSITANGAGSNRAGGAYTGGIVAGPSGYGGGAGGAAGTYAGGGAGGYAGAGGIGASTAPALGGGGAGGGGAGGNAAYCAGLYVGAGGGGVQGLGQGASGVSRGDGGSSGTSGNNATMKGGYRGGGSGGKCRPATGSYGLGVHINPGGGGATAYRNGMAVTPCQPYTVVIAAGYVEPTYGWGGTVDGFVRIVWPGYARYWPSTNVSSNP